MSITQTLDRTRRTYRAFEFGGTCTAALARRGLAAGTKAAAKLNPALLAVDAVISVIDLGRSIFRYAAAKERTKALAATIEADLARIDAMRAELVVACRTAEIDLAANTRRRELQTLILEQLRRTATDLGTILHGVQSDPGVNLSDWRRTNLRWEQALHQVKRACTTILHDSPQPKAETA